MFTLINVQNIAMLNTGGVGENKSVHIRIGFQCGGTGDQYSFRQDRTCISMAMVELFYLTNSAFHSFSVQHFPCQGQTQFCTQVFTCCVEFVIQYTFVDSLLSEIHYKFVETLTNKLDWLQT